MKSIRRSLIVYGLLLLTAALGAVSWFSYRTTVLALRERQGDSQKVIHAQYDAQSKAVADELDRRILEQARTMARTARAVTVHTDGQSVFGSIVWMAQDIHPPLTHDVAREVMRTPFKQVVLIEDDLVASARKDGAQEYYQTYLNHRLPIQRSASLGDQAFTLDEELAKKATPLTEYFDDVELASGKRLRRVTLKAPVSRVGGNVPTPRMYTPFGRPGGWKGGAPPKNPTPKDMQPKDPFPKGPPMVAGVFPVQTVYIQYASDTGPTEAQVHGFRRQRDSQLAALETSIEADLSQLRGRLLWVGLASLAALWLGGYLVICLGLAPLARMTEAVSQVSPKDFHLPLDPETLPNELRPVASRLGETLEQLRLAFEREKQASADISHELRTPLAALMTTLEVGLRKVRSPEEYREILEECHASGQHMYQLVERLLTLARLDAGADQFRPATVDVVETALHAVDIIRPLARARGLSLSVHVPDQLQTETDPNKVREVLMNLLHNAVEYNRPDGSITLTVEPTNGHIRFEVQDTGIGIKPESLPRLFERFYRADPSRHADTPHAGLGLAIVKSYVDLMGGTIQVESSEAGTTFRVEIPRVEPKSQIEYAVEALAM